MPRLARQLVDDSCYHLLTRGNNRAAIFHEPADYQRYGQLLLEYLPAHGLPCGAYVDLNPVRARMVKRPQDYPWSSAQAYLQNRHDPLLTFNPRYVDLGRTATDRRQRYEQFLADQLAQPTPTVEAPAGSMPHLRHLASVTGRSLPLKQRGRPRKRVSTEGG